MLQYGVEIEGQENLIKYITQFYKELFGHSKENMIMLNLEGITTVTQEHINVC